MKHYKPTGKIIFFSKAELDEWVFKERSKKTEDRSQNENDTSTSLGTKDPNQIEMELDGKTGNEKRESEETEILIEFPLKSRRKK